MSERMSVCRELRLFRCDEIRACRPRCRSASWWRCRFLAARVLQPCQPHVEDLGHAHALWPLGLRHQQVGRLDVAVDQALFVGMLQAQRRLADVVARRGESAAARTLDQRDRSMPSTYSITKR